MNNEIARTTTPPATLIPIMGPVPRPPESSDSDLFAAAADELPVGVAVANTVSREVKSSAMDDELDLLAITVSTAVTKLTEP